MPDRSGLPAADPDVLVLRAAFVPDGETAPPEFSADMQPLSFSVTVDPETGAFNSDTTPDMLPAVTATFHPDQQDDSDGLPPEDDLPSETPA